MKRSDVEFAWQAFAVPGQYEVSVALWDKKSGEHNFLRRLFHVGAYKNDPLPEMWRGLDAFEFWSTKRDGPEYMFHSDIEGRQSAAGDPAPGQDGSAAGYEPFSGNFSRQLWLLQQLSCRGAAHVQGLQPDHLENGSRQRGSAGPYPAP